VINLTDIELFKDLTSVEVEDRVIDLHNNYNCRSINYTIDNKTIEILFELRDTKLNKLCLLFEGAVIAKSSYFFNRTTDASTINSFYRGKFEANGGLLEYSVSGESYFYMEFEEGDTIEMFAKKVTLSEQMSVP
jgi:hypothetical protein